MRLKKWHKVGFYWGFSMYIMMIFVWPLINGNEITIKKTLIGIPVWILGGLAFGYSQRKNLEKS